MVGNSKKGGEPWLLNFPVSSLILNFKKHKLDRKCLICVETQLAIHRAGFFLSIDWPNILADFSSSMLPNSETQRKTGLTDLHIYLGISKYFHCSVSIAPKISNTVWIFPKGFQLPIRYWPKGFQQHKRAIPNESVQILGN
jgi:hypothetical protein